MLCSGLFLGVGAFEVYADDYGTWHRKAIQALKRKDFVRALEAFKSCVEADPTNMDGYFNVGNVARHLKRCKDVLLYFRGFLALSPGTPDDKTAKEGIRECEKKERTGTLTVLSDPSGAEVLVDGVFVGTTPLRELVLPHGEFVLKLRHPDCQEHVERVTVTAQELTKVNLSLALKPAFGYLEVKTEPAEGVSVWIGDEMVGVTPVGPLKLPVGKVLVRFEKPGYDRWVRAVFIKKDTTQVLEATLEPLPESALGDGMVEDR